MVDAVSRRRGIGVTLMAIALAIIAGNALAAPSPDSVDPTIERDPYAGLPTTEDGEPTLTKEQVEHTIAIVKADPIIQAATSSVDVAQIGPWIERNESGEPRLVGASLVLRLGEKTDFSMETWPAVQYDDDPADTFGDTYSKDSSTFAVSDATQLMVDVDLSRRAVVGITPEGPSVEFRGSPAEKVQESTGY